MTTKTALPRLFLSLAYQALRAFFAVVLIAAVALLLPFLAAIR